MPDLRNDSCNDGKWPVRVYVRPSALRAPQANRQTNAVTSTQQIWSLLRQITLMGVCCAPPHCNFANARFAVHAGITAAHCMSALRGSVCDCHYFLSGKLEPAPLPVACDDACTAAPCMIFLQERQVLVVCADLITHACTCALIMFSPNLPVAERKAQSHMFLMPHVTPERHC